MKQILIFTIMGCDTVAAAYLLALILVQVVLVNRLTSQIQTLSAQTNQKGSAIQGMLSRTWPAIYLISEEDSPKLQHLKMQLRGSTGEMWRHCKVMFLLHLGAAVLLIVAQFVP